MESSGDYDPAVGDYKPGSITRVKLENFLTYNNVEFCPGPRYVGRNTLCYSTWIIASLAHCVLSYCSG
jgi:hypothetical protein